MEKKVSKVTLNGEVLMDIHEDTVSPEVLAEDETAHDRSGEGIRGTAQFGGDTTDCYKVTDPISADIDNADYIPFNDVSDAEAPKKKTLFSAIVDKLKTVFVQKTEVKPHTYDEGTEIPANSDLNDYTNAGVYKIAPDATAATISNIPIAHAGKLIVMEGFSANETYKMQLFIEHGNTYYSRRTTGSVWSLWENFTGATGINENNRDGVRIYPHGYNGTRGTLKWGIEDDTHLRHEFFNGTSWKGQKTIANIDDISPSSVGDGYAEGTVNGSAITATISGFKLRSGVIVVIKINSEISSACTLNINNTGAKSIKMSGGDDPSQGAPIHYGISSYMYDGTVYRYLAFNRVPRMGDQSYVANTSGNILIDWGYGSDRAQIKHSISLKRLLYNYYTNGAWRGDKQLVDVTGNQTMEGWLKLPAGNGITIASGAHAVAVQDTIPNIINELRFSNGAWGSFNLGTAYTLNYTTIPTGWYNYFYIPHRVGGENWATPTTIFSSDNVAYGTLMLFGMNNSNGMFRIRWHLSDSAIQIDELEDLQKGNMYVGTCSTAADQKEKVATVDGNFVLRKGVRVAIKFTSTNTYSSSTANPITLNVNNTGAKNIWYGSNHSGASGGPTGTANWVFGSASRYCHYVYDGTYWVWDGSGTDNNSTNFLRNDASSTLTASGGPFINIKCSSIDITQADNAVTSTQYPAYVLQDKNGKDMSRLETVVETNGQVRTYLQVCNYNSSTNTHFRCGLSMYTNKSQDMWYSMTNPHYFARAIGHGYGTCSTAADQRIKEVTCPRFVLTNGAVIHVKFTNTNTYNSQTANPIQLNVNGTGAKNIWYNAAHSGSGNTGTNTRIYGEANRTFTYMYDGTYWVWLGCGYEADTVDPHSLGFGYGICDTAAATAAKVVAISNYTIRTGGYVSIRFVNDVPANATLNINSRGAKSISYRNALITAGKIKAGDVATFIYDGTYYRLVANDRWGGNVSNLVTNISTQVTWSPDIVGACSSLTTGTAHVYLQNDHLIYASFECTYKGSTGATIHAYQNETTNVFFRCKIPGMKNFNNCYSEVIADVNGTLYPAWARPGVISNEDYLQVMLRKAASLPTGDGNIRFTFTLMVDY